MTAEEHHSIRSRYVDFSLTLSQAEKVYQFEQEKNFFSMDNHLSVWEEFDFTFDSFQQILEKDQWEKFVTFHNDHIKRHGDFLVESDQRQIKYITYHNELLEFYENSAFPQFFLEKFLTAKMSIFQESSKVEFLKKEYKAFLNDQKMAVLSSHYRNSRRFQPNKLKAALLRHQFLYVIPDFRSFKVKMDQPTMATARFLLEKFLFVSERYQDFFKQQTEEQRRFAEAIRLKHLGEVKGWHVTLTETEEQMKERQIMELILIDKEKYGLAPLQQL